MIKRLSFTVGCLALATSAQAAPLTLSVSGGGWNNPVAPSSACVDIDAASGTGQDEVRWGGGVLTSDPLLIGSVPSSLSSYVTGGDACWATMATSGYNGLAAVSGYNFDPFDGTYVFPGSATPFVLGSFQHLNFPIQDALTQITYTLNLGHNAAGTNPLPIDLIFQHNETDNLCNTGPNCSDDIVTVVIPNTSVLFQVGTDQYLFQLLGFSPTGQPGTFASLFTSPENGTNFTELWATVTPVPEPATLTLLGTGLLGVGAAARRRRQRKAAASAQA